MLTPPKNLNAHLASAWAAGVAVLFLGIGLQGAGTPLMPTVASPIAKIDLGDEVMVEEFNPPPAPAEAEVAEPVLQDPVIEEIEIPPVPEMVTPLTIPEMVELTPLEPILEKPKPDPVVKPPEPKPKPVAQRSPPKPQTQGTPGGTGAPALFTGGGRGRFPSPYYPASARSAGLQGSVRLLVTVEANGSPSSVSVTQSSGHAQLDSAARDQVQRRWRWPAGEVRRFIVPIRFVLQ
jgi:protein TonB